MNKVVSKAYQLLPKFKASSGASCDQDLDQSKRSFLGGLVGASGLAIAPGVMLYETANAKPADQAVTDAVRW